MNGDTTMALTQKATLINKIKDLTMQLEAANNLIGMQREALAQNESDYKHLLDSNVKLDLQIDALETLLKVYLP